MRGRHDAGPSPSKVGHGEQSKAHIPALPASNIFPMSKKCPEQGGQHSLTAWLIIPLSWLLPNPKVKAGSLKISYLRKPTRCF